MIMNYTKVLFVCPNQWVNHTENLIKKYIGENDKDSCNQWWFHKK